MAHENEGSEKSKDSGSHNLHVESVAKKLFIIIVAATIVYCGAVFLFVL